MYIHIHYVDSYGYSYRPKQEHIARAEEDAKAAVHRGLNICFKGVSFDPVRFWASDVP